MAGHNKWSQIKHKKAKEDAKRGKSFSKLIKEITVAARKGGGDSAGNAHLRQLLEKAKNINMPAQNAIRAIKRGTEKLPGTNYEDFIYEGYGPNNIAVIIEILSDNKNRTVAALRHLFTAKGGHLADTGSVSWMFEKLGVIRAIGTITEDKLLETLFKFDIKDIRTDENTFFIMCNQKSLEIVKQAMQNADLKIESFALEWIAKNRINLDKKDEEKALDFLSALHDHDDVQNVYTNLA